MLTAGKGKHDDRSHDRNRPSWPLNSLFPLVRIVVLAGGLLSHTARTEERFFLAKDSPALGAAMAIYVGFAWLTARLSSIERLNDAIFTQGLLRVGRLR